jgi:hypothetical protein
MGKRARRHWVDRIPCLSMAEKIFFRINDIRLNEYIAGLR